MNEVKKGCPSWTIFEPDFYSRSRENFFFISCALTIVSSFVSDPFSSKAPSLEIFHKVLDLKSRSVKSRQSMASSNNSFLGSEVNLMVVKNPWKIYIYLSKYMQKNFDDGRLFGKKKYFGSRNLKRPIVLVGDTTEDDVVIELVQRWMPDGFKLQPRSFSTDFCGDMTIEPYRLPGYQTLSDFKSLDAYVVERLKSKGYREI